MIKKLIVRLVKRTTWYNKFPLTTWHKESGKPFQVATRYAPFWKDEFQGGDDKIHDKLPWWRPFNILLHNWRCHDDGYDMHDHPRWSITICLRGRLIEKTPWKETVLTPGKIVFRSTKYIHGFKVDKKDSCKTWTLFIVGRRKKCQNTYVVTRRTQQPIK